MIPACRGVFVTGPATNAGKTFISRGLTAALVARGLAVLALKPIETGLASSLSPLEGSSQARPSLAEPGPNPLDANHALALDALALARAAGRPELARWPGFYRALPPLSPYAAALATGTHAPDVEHVRAAIADALERSLPPADFLLVEGAGGLLVPLDREHTIADLALALGLPLLLVARDELGVLSALLTAYESAERRNLSVAAIVLTPASSLATDRASEHNATILRERLPCPVLSFPRCEDDDGELARAAHAAGLVGLLTLS